MRTEHDHREPTTNASGIDSKIQRRAFLAAGVATLITPAIGLSETEEAQMTDLKHINPETMYKNPAFTRGIVIPAGASTLLVGGQSAVDEKGEVVGKGDIAAQTSKAVDNLITVLETAGTRLEDVVRVGLFVREDADLKAAFGAWMERAGQLKKPPTVTTAIVSKLANPDYLIEIEATAVVY